MFNASVFVTCTLTACMPLNSSTVDAAPAGDGYLHVFGVHVPALAAVFVTIPIVWLAAEVVHRVGRR